MNTKHSKYLIIFSLFFSLSALLAQNTIQSQWRGPDRSGIYPNEKLLKEWPSQGPKLLWSNTEIGVGNSSPAVTDKFVYINGMVDDTGYLHAFDLKGKLVWKSNYGEEWSESYPGARSTPTVVDGMIYFSNAHTQIFCINASNGKLVWQRNMTNEFSARNLRWGMTESLLVIGNKLYCTPGGSQTFMAILDRSNGKVLNTIKADGKQSAYCSPALINHNGRSLIVTMTENSLICIDVKSEKILWQKEHQTRYSISPNTPIYHNGYVFITSGYGTTGSQMFKLNEDASDAQLIWKQKILDSQLGSAILVDGYIYGSGHKNKGWHCLDQSDGKVMYTSDKLGKKGNIIYADGLLYCYDENGMFGLVKPDPTDFRLISKFEVPMGSDQHWAHPVISNGRLFIRHGDALMVYDIASK
jgi:outer membrane protein assembly factor BamB